MKYGMVRQFSNNAIDNAFSFVYKIVDFGKIFLDMVLSFIDIWVAFFSIFYNIFMYIYYFILFVIDWTTQSRLSMFLLRRKDLISSKAPTVTITSGPNPIPHMYGKAVNAASAAADSAKTTLSSLKPGAVQKKSLLKSIAEGFLDFIQAIITFFKRLASGSIDFYDKKVKPIKESDKNDTKSKSLIDEYIKEYEQKKH